MEQFEKSIKEHNLRQAMNVDLEFDKPMEEIVKAEFSTEQREKLADKDEAMPGGSYPIRNGSDLKNAIQAFGRAKDKEKAKAWIKRRAKELGKEGELPEGWDCSGSAKTEKALEDELEKARSGVYANNAQNKKQARVGERYGAAVHGGQTHGVEEEGKLSKDDLKEHAKNASEQALANAIKTSPDPTVRQVAHAEMKRRQSEEKSGAGDSFPGKSSDEGEKPEKVKFAEKPATNLKNPKKEPEKKTGDKKPEEKKKEPEKKDDNYKKIKELRPLLQHFEEKYGKDWINKMTKEEEEYHGKIVDKDFGEFDRYINSKHRETVGKKIEKSIQGIRYF